MKYYFLLIIIIVNILPVQNPADKTPLLRVTVAAQVSAGQDTYTVRAWSLSQGWKHSKGRVSILRNGQPLFEGNVGEVNYAPTVRTADIDAFNEPRSVSVTATDGADRVHIVLYEHRRPVLILPLEATTAPIVQGSEAVRIEEIR